MCLFATRCIYTTARSVVDLNVEGRPGKSQTATEVRLDVAKDPTIRRRR